jgi:PKD repeat protein
MNRFRVYGLTCVLMIAAAAAKATTIVMPTDEQLIAKSPVIVTGTVLSTAAVERNGAIWTESSIAISNVLKGKGSAAETITVRELGGELDGRFTKIFGGAEYKAGERVMLFLEAAPQGGYRTLDLFVGKMTEGRAMDGRRLWMRDDAGADVAMLDANFEPIVANNVQRDAPAFETFVKDRVAGRAGSRNYGVENPVLAKENGGGGKGAQENFTLISEPRVYRWTRFDGNQSAAWFSSGTQTGYGGGGVNELSTAMSSWTSYSQAKIFYSYSGVRSGTLGGLSSPNGVNEVLFNDPLSEIAGTFSGSGVVGTGGFNGVSGAANWTAPFDADATHTAGAKTVFNITEGNLTIQDGVTPTGGISSSRLAEIIAHEFGHTLGLGHSADSTALMYAYVTGIGPSLRGDDQVAARWLYPNGTVTPPATTAPAAPSNLNAVASGSNVILSWTDNANNESTQTIYMATGSGSFSSVSNAGANVTSAQLSGFAAGTYRFYVIASNSAGSSAASNTATATVAATLTASFSFTPSTGGANATTFTFYDESRGTVTSRTWNFGDGSTSSAATAQHVYARAGQYTVTLNVSGNNLSSSASKTVTVTNPLIAAFSWSPSNPTINDNVTFTDQSTGGVSSWYWTFGDGSVTQEQNPAKRFNTPGTYAVTLSVTRGSENAFVSRSIVVSGSAPTLPPVVPYRSLVSAAAQQNGIGGTAWRTELSLFNAGSQGANVNALYIPTAGASVITRSFFLAPKQSAIYANTLLDLFGIANGAGAVAIEATSASESAQLRVTSRTFTNGSSGTYGQSVPDVRSSDLEATLYLTGMQSNAAYRTNVGLVNRGASNVNATATLYDGNGSTISTVNVTIPANNFQQSSLVTFFPEAEGRSFSALSMRVTTSSQDVVTAFASVIDNNSQDPVYMQAMPARGGSSITIPAVGRANGANGTFWRSDVIFFNPSNALSILTLRFGSSTKSLALSARQTYVVSDILTQFGLSAGGGPLYVTWSSGSAPVVTSRTYTTDERGGTYGQSVDPIDAFASEMFVPGLRSDVSYRSNVGIFNGGSDAEELVVTLYSPAGYELGNTRVVLQGGESMQQAVTAMFPGVSASTGSFTLYVRGDANAKIFAYGSMIDNASGDPVFFAGR